MLWGRRQEQVACALASRHLRCPRLMLPAHPRPTLQSSSDVPRTLRQLCSRGQSAPCTCNHLQQMLTTFVTKEGLDLHCQRHRDAETAQAVVLTEMEPQTPLASPIASPAALAPPAQHCAAASAAHMRLVLSSWLSRLRGVR